MFETEKSQMAIFFGYYEKKFEEKVWVAIESYESDNIMIDLILGEDTNRLCGAIVSQYIGTDEDEDEDEVEDEAEEEVEEEGEEEEEDDYDIEEEENDIVDYNLIRFTPEDEKSFKLTGKPYISGECRFPMGEGILLPFTLYATTEVIPDTDEIEVEITGMEVRVGPKDDQKRIFLQEDPALDALFAEDA